MNGLRFAVWYATMVHVLRITAPLLSINITLVIDSDVVARVVAVLASPLSDLFLPYTDPLSIILNTEFSIYTRRLRTSLQFPSKKMVV